MGKRGIFNGSVLYPDICKTHLDSFTGHYGCLARPMWIGSSQRGKRHHTAGRRAGGKQNLLKWLVGFYESVEMGFRSNFLGSFRRQVGANVGLQWFYRFFVFFVSPFGLNDLQIITN